MSGASDQQAGGEQVQVRFKVVVTDRDALREYVKRRYAACWFERDWEPADLAEAVLEALVVSNENPSPDEYGIELLETQATLMPDG
jgi:hypothetical protein